MKNNSLYKYKVILVALVSSLVITGVGFIDHFITKIILAIISFSAYIIVEALYSIHLFKNKKEIRDALTFFSIILLLIILTIYNIVLAVTKWVLLWPLWCKILIPILLIAGIITIIYMILKKKNKFLESELQENKNSHE